MKIEIGINDWRHIIRAMTATVNPRNPRAALRGICLHLDGSDLDVYGGDGSTMTHIRVSVLRLDDGTEPETVSMPLVKVPPKVDHVHLETLKGFAQLIYNTRTGNRIEEQVPLCADTLDYARVFGSCKDATRKGQQLFTIHFDPVVLIRALEAYTDSGNPVRMVFGAETQAVIITGATEPFTEALALPVKP